MSKEPQMYPYSEKMTRRFAKLIGLLYGRGKRD